MAGTQGLMMSWGFGSATSAGRITPAVNGSSPFSRPPYDQFVQIMIGLGRRLVADDPDDDRRVCRNCFSDPALKRLVTHLGQPSRCSFCRRRPALRRAAPLAQVAAFIAGCFDHWFDAPEGTLLLDDEGHGFAGDIADAQDMVWNWVGLTDDGDALAKALAWELSDGWWCTDPGYDGERRQDDIEAGADAFDAWRAFCRIFANHSRFLFWRDDAFPVALRKEPSILVTPCRLFREIGRAVELAGLIGTHEASMPFYRARWFAPGGPVERSASQLGPPPRAFAQANRMSAQGIAMFYGALEPKTAVAEVASEPGCVAIARFKPCRPLTLLDLTGPLGDRHWSIFANLAPAEPSLFAFLRRFREAISLPVERDQREHVNYAPTQIVTEFFRLRFRSASRRRLDGILYPSVRHPNGRCVVLFCDRWGVREVTRDDGTRPTSVEPLLSFDEAGLRVEDVTMTVPSPAAVDSRLLPTAPDDEPLLEPRRREGFPDETSEPFDDNMDF